MNIKKLFIGLIFLHSTSYLSYKDINQDVYVFLSKIFLVILFAIMAIRFKDILKAAKIMPSFKYVVAFIFLPLFMTTFACYIVNGQPISASLKCFLNHLFLIIYFVLIAIRMKPHDIIKIIVIVAVVRLLITLIQQFTYPDYMFTLRHEGIGMGVHGGIGEIEIRSGLYRFALGDAPFLLVLGGLYFLEKYLSNKETKYILLFVVMSGGLWLDQYRQYMISFVGALLLYTLFLRGKVNYKAIAAIFFIVLVFYGLRNILFEDLVEISQDQSDDNNPRYLSYLYYLENLGTPITILFGNGFASEESNYGLSILQMEDSGLYRSDIGIGGALHLLGIVFILIFFIYYIRVVLRYRKYMDCYLLMYMIAILIQLPFIFFLYNGPVAAKEFFMAFVFYLIDISILNHKKVASQTIPQNKTKR